MYNFQVVVGNIGTVYDGDDAGEATETYEEYAKQSRKGYGRAADEEVSLFIGGEWARHNHSEEADIIVI